ncbi:MAG TPA: hypothetical protein VM409_04350 [Chloroflexia bacterium]|nr:hypothetical protein [Chloroflexia bacterium]
MAIYRNNLKQFRKVGISGLVVGILSLALVACGGEAATVAPTATTGSSQESPATPSSATGLETSTADTGGGSSPVETAAPSSDADGSSVASTPSVAPASTASCTRLNLNDVTEAQLMDTIPGFSSRMVREFMEYRPYSSILQFRREIGKYVDANQVAEYEKYVYVPVDPNGSDAATLMQIPGVDETVAAQLANGRPYASADAFSRALSSSLNAQQLSDAQCYLASNR